MKTTKRNIRLLLYVSSTLILASCKKNDTGGKAGIHAHIQHHNTEIMSSTVYVKFNAQEAPSDPTNTYDLKIEGEETDNHVHINGLRPGEYYLYAVGVDTSINKIVTGGTAVKITWKDRKKTIETVLEVGE